MKKNIFLYTYFATLSIITTANALTATTNSISETYRLCKQKAITHREETMRPALREYVASSSEITNNAKNNYMRISWYIDSSYRINSKKIQTQKKQAMIPVTAKINKVRTIAENTWKAEDSLCEILYNTASTTPKKSLKK
jgi:hypothetical protein